MRTAFLKNPLDVLDRFAHDQGIDRPEATMTLFRFVRDLVCLVALMTTLYAWSLLGQIAA